MRVRKQSSTGDYVIGRGSRDFYVNNPELVGQRINTRLLFWEGEWFLDTQDGTPWLQKVLGYGNATVRDQVIKARILGTPGVTSINTYSGVATASNRSYTVQGTVITQFSTQPIPFGPVTLS